MRVHVLQHAPFEGLGTIEHWLQQQNASVTDTQLYAAAEFPPVDQVDLIIALGGPMSVNDEAELPWLIAEKRFIAEAIDQGVAILGICLGAQLIASATGKAVYPGTEKEIGWHPIQAVPGTSDSFQFPASAHVLHWHGETFDLPEGATHLARSVACEHQAFQLGRNVIGLQFHIEMNRQSVETILEHCAADLTEGRYVQAAQVIRGAAPARYAAIEQILTDLLSYLTRDAVKRN